MTKLQFTAQMFECCIRQDVHIVAQKHYENWLKEVCANDEIDPTKYCDGCGAMFEENCKCGKTCDFN